MRNRPLRIAYIDQRGELGGAEHLLLTLLGGLPGETIKPLLICGQDGPFPREAGRLGVQTYIIPLPYFCSLSFVVNQRKVFNPVAALWNLQSVILSAWRIKLHLQSLRVDLIHTNSDFAHIYGGLAARLLGIPCVWYFHDLIETRRLLGMAVLVWRVLARMLACRVVGVSNAVVQALSLGARGCVIYAGHRERVNKNDSDLRARFNLPADSKLIGYIGRIGYAKGVDILAESAQQVISVEPRSHFLVFGEALFGQTRYKHALVEAVHQMKLENHWHWVGYDSEAAHSMPALDLVVLPSRREALPLVLLEAAMAKKAAIAARVGGNTEVIIDGETGILVPPENPEELASAILQLIQAPNLADKMGRMANQRVRHVFDPKRFYAGFLQLYASLRT